MPDLSRSHTLFSFYLSLSVCLSFSKCCPSLYTLFSCSRSLLFSLHASQKGLLLLPLLPVSDYSSTASICPFFNLPPSFDWAQISVLWPPSFLLCFSTSFFPSLLPDLHLSWFFWVLYFSPPFLYRVISKSYFFSCLSFFLSLSFFLLSSIFLRNLFHSPSSVSPPLSLSTSLSPLSISVHPLQKEEGEHKQGSHGVSSGEDQEVGISGLHHDGAEHLTAGWTHRTLLLGHADWQHTQWVHTHTHTHTNTHTHT